MASSNSGQNNPLTYMDGVSVKIAENYKPPKRIPMVMSYSQRVALNKLIQEPMSTYDFTMEESIKSKMYEWQKARTAIIEQRKLRLNQLTQAMNSKWETNENITDNEVLDSKDSVSESSDNKEEHVKDSRIATADPYYQTESGILIPKVFHHSSQQTKMSTPMHVETIKTYTNPINYSEFESDTSSPFDNMELKIINDLEELAQVLKYDSDDNVTHSYGASQKNYVTTSPKTHKLMNYVSDNIFSNRDNMPIYGLDHNVKKNPINGYYYDNYSQNSSSQMTSSKEAIRSVPEIMKSLQADLANTRITETLQKPHTPTPVSSVSSGDSDGLEDPFKNLSSDLQKMAIKISSMGFPLARVARACQLLEGNQKKVSLLQLNNMYFQIDFSTILLYCK